MAARPTVLFAAVGLLGIVVSVTGNETARRLGRSKVVVAAISVAAGFAMITGWSTGVSAPLAFLCVLLRNAAIYLDSSALTAGTVQAADPELRGAMMGLHSMAGYSGGFIGPLGVGLVLDLAGGDGIIRWGLGFGHLAVITLGGLAVLRRLSRSDRRQAPASVIRGTETTS